MRGNTSVQSGFSLLELTASMAILMVIGGAAFSSLVGYQKNYQSTMSQLDMHSGVRSAVEIATQEVGQAGVVPNNSYTVLGAVPATGSQTVTVNTVTGLYVGEFLTVDTGSSQEVVTVTGLTTTPNAITANFLQTHTGNVPIQALGVFGQGIMTTSTANQLRIFGDINADGNLEYVHYDCDYTNGQLTRSVTLISPTMPTISNAGVALVQNLQPNPNGTPCFTYTTTSVNGTSYYTSVGMTLTTETAVRDPQTNQYTLMTKSFLNLSPRNVVAAVELNTANMNTMLQNPPSGLLTLQ